MRDYNGRRPATYDGRTDNDYGRAALVLGVASFPLGILFGFGVLTGLLAMGLGLVGGLRVRDGRASNGLQAWSGLLIGALAVVAILAVFGPAVLTHLQRPPSSGS